MPDIKVLERHAPRPVVYFMAKAFGWKCPPVLVTFRDKQGNIRREELPL